MDAAAPQIVAQPQPRTVIEGASYTFNVTATGTGPLAYQWRRNAANLSGRTASSLALTAITTNDAGVYTVVITNVDGAITSAPAPLTVRLASDPVYPSPQGGWLYLFQGNAASGELETALDGTWDHSTDNWAGDGRGAAVPPEGGIEATNGILTIEDAVATGSGFNNRRLYLTHNLTNEPTVTNAATLLNEGVTLTFRARLTPATDPLIEISNAPNGLINNSDGKGMFGIRQAGASGMIVGFSLNQASEDLSPTTTFNFAQAGLHMNNLNGDVRASMVDPGEPGTINLVPLDPSLFHEFWITIQDNAADPGTHRVSVYLDGSQTPTVFNVTAGVGSDGPATSYLALGLGSSGQRGAVDVDFFGYRPGVVIPSAFNQPVGFAFQPTNVFVATGQLASFSVGVTGTPPYSIQWYRGGGLISGATNTTYVTGPVVPADQGAQFTVVVTADSASITSSPPAILQLLALPVITGQPQSLSVTNGDPATFAVAATSPGPLTYQWRFNEANLPGKTGSDLLLSSVAASDAGTYDVIVSNSSGSITSSPAVLSVVLFDFGDALGHPTLLSENGARHRITGGLRLGASIDGEPDGQPSLVATGDDSSGTDDEDGVIWLEPLRVGRTAALQVVASANGLLSGWFDFDRNGSWGGPGEQVYANVALVAGTNSLSVPVPAGASLGNAYARFRFSTAGSVAFAGPAADGEVEDYAITFVAVADLSVAMVDAPDPIAATSNLTYSITVSNAGPSSAASVNLTGSLPAGVAFVSALPSQGACEANAGIVSCSLDTLSSGAVAGVTLIVTPAAATNLTNTVTVSNIDFDPVSANNAATVTTVVLNGPTITTQPQGLTVTNGGSGTLSVVAAGTAPLAYQWLLGETVLAGQTSATLNLVNLQAAAAGAYRVRVTNSVGGVLSDPAIVTVLVGPAITAQPQSLTNFAGGSAAFSVIATGSAPLSYQWLFNGTNAISGATTPEFTLPQTNPTNAGNYRVVITNLAGVVTSLVATLTVISADFGDAPPSYPTLLIDNGARHRLAPGVRLGAAADFEPDANTTPPALGDDLSGADDEDGVVFSTPLRTGQSASLSITASTNGVLNAWIDYGRDGSWAEPGDQIFTNRNLTTGANSLAVLVPAGVDIGLTYARFRFGTATGLSFAGEAANGEVEDYEVNLEPVADVGVARVVAIDPVAVGGEEVYTITLTNVGPAQATGVALADVLPPGLTFISALSSQGGCTFSAGTVDCAIGLLAPGAAAEVTITGVPSAAGSMTNTATVTANETDLNAGNNSVKTSVSVQVLPQILTEPQSLTVSNGGTATFSVTASGTGLRYQWRRDGLDLSGATNATLVLPNVQLANAGLYTVRVNNQVGSVLSTEVSLTVLAALAFTSQPQNRSAVVGTTATFSVGVTGSGPVTYQWDRDTVAVPGATQPTLLLENVQTNQAGAYRVRVFNPLGSVTSLTATLTVLVPPSFTLEPESRTNFAGTTASFLAAAEGTLPLGYQWLFNQTNRLANQTNSTLTLTSVQTAQAGAYTLQASNVAGLATSAVAVLTVFEVDFGDAPEALGYPTSLIFNGARHRLLPGVRLGLAADAETNGLPNATATGDDAGGADDEDGVTILAPLVLGQLANVQVVASTNGFLNAWIDFNANGAWADPGDQVLVNAPLTAGTNTVQIPISPTAVTSTTFARFRFGTAPDISYDGFAADGEVEDHAVTIQPGADLTVLVSDNPDPVLVGGNVTYTIVVTNRGPAGATAVLLTNTLTSSFTILTATSTQGSCNNVGGQIVCSLGNLANRGSATVTLTARANAAGTLLCRAAVSANEGDGNPADNLLTHTTAAVTPAVAFSNPAALSVADASASGPGLASSYPSTLSVSGLTGAVYSVTVTLNSISHGFASDLDVLLLGPGGQSVVLMSDCGGNSVMSGVTLTFDDSAALSLPSGGAITPSTYRPSNYDLSEVFPFSAPPPPYGSTLSTFRGTNPNGTWSLYVMDDVPSDTGTISAGWRLNFVTVDPIADLALTAAPLPNPVALGSNLVYTAAVTNRGPAAASAARLTNALPPGVTFVSANASQGSCAHQSGVVTCDLGNLAPAAGAVASITVTPILAGPITNSISVGAVQLDFVSSNNTAQAITTAVPATDVLVAQTASANPVLPGQTLTYTLNVTNRGPNPATNVRLTDPLPPGVSFVSVSTTQGACSNVAGTVFCAFGGLAVGASSRATLAVTVGSTGSLTNTATVLSDEVDSAAANNVASLVVQAGVITDLAVGILNVPDPVPMGSPLTYTIRVTNLGPQTASSVQLTNPLPAGVAFVNATASQGTCGSVGGVLDCALGTMANGAQATVLLTVTPSAVGGLINSAGIGTTLGAGGVDPVPANNLATTATTVLAPPAIATPPQSQTAITASSVTMTVSATGSAPLSYQWLFNATNLNGATSQSLTLNNLTAASAGPYRVRVSNAVGALTSVVATLTVLIPPVISDLTDRQTDEDTPTPVLAFTVGDADSAAAGLEVTALSSNTGLVPVSNIVFGGSAGNRTVQITPARDQSGTATITLRVRDTDNLIATDSFLLTVRAVNDPPTIVDVPSQASPEDATAVIALTIGDVDHLAGDLAVTATSSNPDLVPSANVTTAGTGAARTLTLRPSTNGFGSSTISITVTDTNGAAGGDTFVFTVTPVNDPPTLDPISALSVKEGSGPRVVLLTGITSGLTNELQTLAVTAQSGSPSVIPDPVINYTSPASSGSLTFTPALGATGVVTLTVTVDDGGPINRTSARAFVVTVTPTNRWPAITAPADVAAAEDAVAIIPFTILDLETPASNLVVAARSSNPAVLPNSGLSLSGEGANRTLTAIPVSDQSGETFVTLSASDPDGGTNEHVLRLTLAPVNDPPTLAPLGNLSLPRNAGLQTVGLSNITSGAANEIQALAITATSSAPAIVPHPTVVYTSPGLLGSIRFTPVAGNDALVSITVIVNDGGATNNSLTRSFNVAVSNTNSPPSLADVSDQSTLEDTSIDIPFVVSDPNTPLANLSVVATASDTNLAPATHLAVLGTGATRTLRVQPATNQTGTTTLTLTVSDPLGAFAVESFLLTVLPVADPPSFGPLSDIAGNEDQTNGPIQLQIGSVEMDPALLTVTVTSLEPNLLPDVGLVLSGSGATRSLTFLPAPEQFGTGAILLSVTDTNGLTTDRSLVVTVNPVNDAPTLAPVADVTVDEDSGPRVVTLSGLGPGASNELQWLTFTAVSSNPSLIPNPTVSYVHPQAGASLLFAPIANAAGVATITITVDDGQAANRSVSRTFTITVRPLNDPPDLTSLPSVSLAEDSTRVVPFVVADDTTPLDLLVLEITSSNPILFPAGSMVLGGAGPDRTLTLKPATNASGSTTLTLSVRDTNNASSSRLFTVTVSAENDAPRIAGLGDRSVNEDSSGLTIPFTIEDPETSADTLTLSATSSLPTLIGTGGIVFGGSGTNRTVTVTPLPDQSGAATIAVRVRDAGSRVTSASFVLTVNPVNDLPILSGTPDQTIDEDTVLTLPLALSDNETPLDSLSLVGAAADTVLVPSANVTFTGTGATRALALTPAGNRSGTTTVAVILSDGAGSVTNRFNLVVRSVNDPPTLSALSDLSLAVGAGLQTVNLAGIGTGAADEAQTLAISATSSNPGLIPNPAVNYTSANATGTLTFTPAAGASGSATVTVTVNDGQAQNNTFSRTFVVTVGTAGNVTLFVEAESGTLVAPMLAGSDPTASAGQYVQSATANSGTVTFNLNITQVGDYVVWCRTLSPNSASDSFFVAVDGGTQDIYDTTLVPSSVYQWSLLNGRTTGTPRVLTFSQGVHALTFQTREAFTRLDSLYVTSDRSFAPGASNAPPTLDPIGNLVLSEDNGPRTVNLAGISDGSASETQTVTISAVSSNPALIANPVVTYTSPNTTGSLAFTPVGNASGTATITVTANDGQAVSNTFARTFNVTINAVNDAPTLGAISDLTVNPGAPPQVVNLTGIGSGAPNETQSLVVAASSSNPAVVPAPAVSYASPASSGSLTVAPRPGTNGTAIITVTVNDGGPANPATSRTFTVTVRTTPSIADIPDLILDEDVVSGTIPFAIADLETAAASLTLSATSSDTNLVASTNVVFGGSGANRTLTIRPSTNQFGNTTVTVTVTDGDGLTASDSFEVTVNSVNDAPTLSPLPNRTLGEDSSPQTFPLAGIGSGASNEVQDLVVTATSSNPGLLPDPVVTYTSPGAGGTLTLGPIANATGTATVSVVVADGLSVNGSVTQQFLVTVVATNDPPVLSAIGPVTTREDTPVLVGFTVADLETPGTGLSFAVSSSNPLLLPDGNIVAGGAGGNFALQLTPLPDRNGSSTISLTVTDESGGSSTTNFSFTVQPVNDAPLIGEMASLTISESTSTGALPVVLTDIDSDVATVTVQAQSSNPTLLPSAGMALGGAGGSRTIVLTPATSQIGSSLVTLTATDTGGASSRRVFRLTVQRGGAAPVIITQPGGVTVTNGATVVFTVGAQGTPPLSYQWRRNGLELSGAISSTLTLVSVQASDAGSYTVVVRNSAGSVTSAGAELRVLAPPRITLLRRDGVTTEISFTSSASLNHVVEYRDTVEPGAWTSLPGVVGTGAVLTVTDPASAGPARFYRVRVE